MNQSEKNSAVVRTRESGVTRRTGARVQSGRACASAVAAAGLAMAASFLIAIPAVAADTESLESLKQDVEVLKQEVREAREWRHADSMAHLAGYAAVNYTAPENGTGTFSGTTFNPIFHYAYKDWLLLDSELEVALKDNGESEFKFEYMTVDLVLNDSMVLLAGKFLSPVGVFRRNLHPAWKHAGELRDLHRQRPHAGAECRRH